jgi:hypothetical protein
MEISDTILIELVHTLKHARIFITSREKMNQTGVELYDDVLDYFNSHIPNQSLESDMPSVKIDNTKYEITAQVSTLLQAVSEERDELKDFAIWMTGCGYDFCQHKYFREKRDELLK